MFPPPLDPPLDRAFRDDDARDGRYRTSASRATHRERRGGVQVRGRRARRGRRPGHGCTTAEEARECASKVDVTLLNFGTPTTEEIANAVVDARAVVVDPVGAGLGTRGGVIERWLTRAARGARAARAEGDDGYKTWVKGNRSEMEALVRMFSPIARVSLWVRR